MINKKLFEELLKESSVFAKTREKVIGEARVVLKMSKQAIFCLHRGDNLEANKILSEAEKKLLALNKSKPRSVGAYYEAAEEFVEAKMFLEFLETGKVDFKSKLVFGYETMLSGICDLTGEIVRKAIISVTKNEREKVTDFKLAAEEVVGELIKFDLTGKLRTKFDEAKRNLKRLEEIMYDLEIRK